jgi:D-alanyl-D-alanine dipeptidase
MATAQAALTPTTDTAPAVISIPAKELSGAQWVARFPTSTAISDLTPSFQTAVNSFLAAITAAGGSVTVSATYRPAERAYLMHYSSRLSKGEITAASIPAMVGVNIEWVHATEAASTAAATAMVSGYGIAFPPALVSNHTRRTAIDMTIRNMVGKSIVDAAGTSVGITRLSELNAVGATFGVIKLASDPPHWSEDGH